MSGIHSPSKIKPEDYDYVGCYYLGDDEDGRWAFGDEMYELSRRTSPEFVENLSGKCDSCGTRHLYGSVYRHQPSGHLVQIGNICAMDGALSYADQTKWEIERKKRQAQARKNRRLTNEAALLFEQEHFLSVVKDMVWFDAPVDKPQDDPNLLVGQAAGIAFDIFTKLHRYGSISPAQVALLHRLRMQHLRRLDERKKEIEEAAPVPVTDERITITGEVLSVKWREDDRFGGSLKMVVRDDRGFKVWGTVPSKFDPEVGTEWNKDGSPRNIEKGSRVRFDAAVTPAKDDPTFGFYKRPTKTVLLEATS